MNEAMVFNVQKFSVHDGPGIRTTIFFKGCTMNCAWCHNPESKSFKKEISFDIKKCTLCENCIHKCPAKRLEKHDYSIVENKGKPCTECELCTDFCLNLAREMAGENMSVSQLMKTIESDQVFYNESGGGITFSGGEAMCQIDVLEQLTRLCQSKGIHVAIDTCGHVPFENFEKVVPFTNLILYDIKLMDNDQHMKLTGVDNTLILDNLIKLSQRDVEIRLRLPLIEGVNTDEEHILKVMEFIKDLNINYIHLLPYHDIAVDKYRRFGLEYQGEHFKKPTKSMLNWAQETLQHAGYKVKIGG